MVRILWLKETTRWSRRGIPLRVVWVSPRQLVILLFSILAGLVVAGLWEPWLTVRQARGALPGVGDAALLSPV